MPYEILTFTSNYLEPKIYTQKHCTLLNRSRMDGIKHVHITNNYTSYVDCDILVITTKKISLSSMYLEGESIETVIYTEDPIPSVEFYITKNIAKNSIVFFRKHFKVIFLKLNFCEAESYSKLKIDQKHRSIYRMERTYKIKTKGEIAELENYFIRNIHFKSIREIQIKVIKKYRIVLLRTISNLQKTYGEKYKYIIYKLFYSVRNLKKREKHSIPYYKFHGKIHSQEM